MSAIVSAVFKNRFDASNAVEALLDAGVAKDEISVFVSDLAQKTHFPTDLSGAPVHGLDKDQKAVPDPEYQARVGTLGAIAAGMVGGGIYLSQGIGLLAAGPAAAMAMGAASSAPLENRPTSESYFTELGLSPEDSKFFSEELAKGAILITVHSPMNEHAIRKVIWDHYGYAAAG